MARGVSRYVGFADFVSLKMFSLTVCPNRIYGTTIATGWCLSRIAEFSKEKLSVGFLYCSVGFTRIVPVLCFVFFAVSLAPLAGACSGWVWGGGSFGKRGCSRLAHVFSFFLFVETPMSLVVINQARRKACWEWKQLAVFCCCDIYRVMLSLLAINYLTT